MPELVADCPRCGSKHITFDVLQSTKVGITHGWQGSHETFCVCRRCHKSTVFILEDRDTGVSHYLKEHPLVSLDGAINDLFQMQGFVSRKDNSASPPPELLPPKIEKVFMEASTCLAVGCYNAAAAMYRLCLDMATISLLPEDGVDGLNAKIKRSLGLRLQWLFDTRRLPEALHELSTCVKDDGNDGAHEGTLQQVDAEDLHDFTFRLLERLYTEPERIAQAKARREQRRQTSTVAE